MNEKYLVKTRPHVVILADVSESMAESAGAKTKHEILQEALDYVLTIEPQALVVAFSSFPKLVSQGQLPKPYGGTNLAEALRFIAPWQPKRTVVLSDGLPDNGPDALEQARQLSGRIDVIYCGADSERDAVEFMQKLAAAGRGIAIVSDVLPKLPTLLKKTLALPLRGNP